MTSSAFSPLKKINAENVQQLGLAWSFDLDTARRVQEATPLVIDGVMYVSSAWSKVFALNAATGERIWSYDPKVPGESGVNACCDVANRGVRCVNGKIYVGTLDGRSSRSMPHRKPVWEELTIDRNFRYTITGAPRVVKGKVLIGNGGAEMGVRATSRLTMPKRASSTGASSRCRAIRRRVSNPLRWKKPRPPGKASGGRWAAAARCGTRSVRPRSSTSCNVGTGNGSPWNQEYRSPGGGDNLYLSSIVALKAETGEYVWHYQTTPGETWTSPRLSR